MNKTVDEKNVHLPKQITYHVKIQSNHIVIVSHRAQHHHPILQHHHFSAFYAEIIFVKKYEIDYLC